MEQVYKLSFEAGSVFGYFTPLLFFVLLPRLLIRIAEKNEEGYISSIRLIKIDDNKKKFLIYMSRFMIVVQVILILLFIADIVKVYIPYQRKLAKSVCGEVSMLAADGYEESFEIDGIRFWYNGRSGELGYHKLSDDGGIIEHNGQKVRIDYIETSRRNVIVSIWE